MSQGSLSLASIWFSSVREPVAPAALETSLAPWSMRS